MNRRGRRHRPNVLRRIKPGKTPVVPGSGNQGVLKEKEYKPKRDSDDPSSMSETEQSGTPFFSTFINCIKIDYYLLCFAHLSSDLEQLNSSPYYCRHCFTTDSKDWHHAGN